jgi:hypothetical protein
MNGVRALMRCYCGSIPITCGHRASAAHLATPQVTIASTSTTLIADAASKDEIDMRIGQLKKVCRGGPLSHVLRWPCVGLLALHTIHRSHPHALTATAHCWRAHLRCTCARRSWQRRTACTTQKSSASASPS